MTESLFKVKLRSLKYASQVLGGPSVLIMMKVS